MADKRESSTNRKVETSLGLTLASSSDTQPIAYADGLWDVVGSNSRLASVLDGAGQYDQHTINEALASAGGGTILGSLNTCVCTYDGNAATLNGNAAELNNGGLEADETTFTIPASIHGCGLIPFVICYQNNNVVNFSISKNRDGDIEIGWNAGRVDLDHALLVKILGTDEDSGGGGKASSYVTDDWLVEHGYITEEELDEKGYITEAGANQYVFLCKNYANTTSITIPAIKHNCGLFPTVTCYRDNKVVAASVSKNISGDITVTWEAASDVTPQMPMYISVIGKDVIVDVEEDSGGDEGGGGEPTRQFTATFHLDNGDSDIVYTLDEGDTIEAPNEMTFHKSGYIFYRWSVGIAGTQIHANVEDTALWLEDTPPSPSETYTATFVDWEGSTISQHSYSEGDTIVIPTPTPRTGYNFVDWYCIETHLHEVPATMPAYDLIFSEYMEKVTYTVTYSVMVGADVWDTVTQSYEYEDTITEPYYEAFIWGQESSYEFTGWYNETDGTSGLPNTMPARNLVITAEYEERFGEPIIEEPMD